MTTKTGQNLTSKKYRQSVLLGRDIQVLGVQPIWDDMYKCMMCIKRIGQSYRNL